MKTKSVFLSKTLWVQVLALLSLLVPQVRDWLQANPVEFVSALAAINVLLRFVTSGRVSITGVDDESGPSGISPGLAVSIAAAGLCATALPSCNMPVTGCVKTDQGTVCYSAKGGLVIEVDGRAFK